MFSIGGQVSKQRDPENVQKLFDFWALAKFHRCARGGCTRNVWRAVFLIKKNIYAHSICIEHSVLEFCPFTNIHGQFDLVHRKCHYASGTFILESEGQCDGI